MTALSGSGPAYVFLLVEAMAAAGAKLGLPPDMAMQLARATVAGSGELLRQSSEPASQLRVNVTSPGRHDRRSPEGPDGGRRHPTGVRQGAGRGLAAFEGARGMSGTAKTALDAFLGLIAEKGFADVTLRDVAAAAGLGLADLYRLYPDKMALAAAFMARIDAEVLAGTPSPDRPRGDGARPAVRRDDAPLRRAEAPPRGPARRSAAPARATRCWRWRWVRRCGGRWRPCWRPLGVPSDGLPGAVRQNGLLAIHYAVSRVFDRDDTADLSKTMAALDSRLKTAESGRNSLINM